MCTQSKTHRRKPCATSLKASNGRNRSLTKRCRTQEDGYCFEASSTSTSEATPSRDTSSERVSSLCVNDFVQNPVESTSKYYSVCSTSYECASLPLNFVVGFAARSRIRKRRTAYGLVSLSMFDSIHSTRPTKVR
jgi:hypothetical protein